MIYSPFKSLCPHGRVYAFLELDHPAVAWAVMRGMLVSASCAANSPGFISFMQAGMILSGNNSRIFNESIIEQWRTKFFLDKTSRMRGLYFFESRQNAEARIGDPAWPPYFCSANLIELDLWTDRQPTRLDANWITFANVNPQTGRIKIDDLDWISNYWLGQQHSAPPVWEILSEGVALVLDEGVRRQCNSYLEGLFPRSHVPILMARLASEVGTRGGLVHPFLLRENADTVRLGYLWSDAEFHDLEAINKIKAHPDSGKLAKIISENETWNTPDFRPWGRLYTLETQLVPKLGDLNIPSVHG